MLTSVPLAALLAGMGLGLLVAVPIGPMGILCIHRTLAFGLLAGLVTGLAGATVQAVYGTIALVGLAGSLAGGPAGLWPWLSAAFLVWYALRLLRRTVPAGPGGSIARAPLMRLYAAGVALGFANPLTIALYLSAAPGWPETGGVEAALAFVCGIFAGAAGWYVVLSTAVSVCRGGLSPRMLGYADKAAACILIGLAAATVGRAAGLP